MDSFQNNSIAAEFQTLQALAESKNLHLIAENGSQSRMGHGYVQNERYSLIDQDGNYRLKQASLDDVKIALNSGTRIDSLGRRYALDAHGNYSPIKQAPQARFENRYSNV